MKLTPARLTQLLTCAQIALLVLACALRVGVEAPMWRQLLMVWCWSLSLVCGFAAASVAINMWVARQRQKSPAGG
jgi:hypothetical protein